MDQSYHQFVNKGNEIFRATVAQVGLAPSIFEKRMNEAIHQYKRAEGLCRDDDNKSSILKNIAITQFRLGEKLYQSLKRKMAYQSLIEFFLKESMTNFSSALLLGRQVKDEAWRQQVEEKQSSCAALLWQFIVEDPRYRAATKENFTSMTGRLLGICWEVEGKPRGTLFLRLGNVYLKKAVEYDEAGDKAGALQLLNDNYMAIEEAKKHLGPTEEVVELEEVTYIHVCIADSSLAIQKADGLWRQTTQETEELDMELVWDSVDLDCHAIILSREKCLESEAIAHSRLGKVYESLIVKD